MSLILIADDHPIAREPLARLLRHEGYETVCAANGLQALDAIRARRPDLIILDLMMPKMSGLAFLEVLRSTAFPGFNGTADAAPTEGPATAEVPVIVVTAVPSATEVARVRELGVKDVIIKSRFDLDDLMARIRALLTCRVVTPNRACA